LKNWTVTPDYVGTAAGKQFRSLEAAFAASGEVVSRDSLCSVIRVKVDTKKFYLKRYVGNGRTLIRRWFGLRGLLPRQRVTQEWENLLDFERRHIPAARVVAYGMERHFGRFVRGAVITEEIPDTIDLAKIASNADIRMQSSQWLSSVSRQVAEIARTMHDAGFSHNDLKWRNILVDRSNPPKVYLIDCPRGYYWWSLFLQHRIVKDLVELHESARDHLSRTKMLRFYLDYRGHARLTPADKAQIRRILDRSQ
jgi:tRNA A-37 threonylcarbamoyl transferase component Bud32